MAVFNPGHAKERFVLFVRPRDREMEIWNGRRAGVEGAIATYGADAAYTHRPARRQAARVLDGPATPSYYRLGNAAYDARILRLLDRAARHPVRAASRRPCASRTRGRSFTSCGCAARPPSWRCQRRACEISRDAHIEAMRCGAARHVRVRGAGRARVRLPQPGGSPRNGYPSIVASGPNACILHYTENNRRMEDGDLLLIDAGCECGYHAADITRTFPGQRALHAAAARACTRWC